MADTPNASGNVPPGQAVVPYHAPFPIIRLLYAFFYGLIAWVVLYVLFLLAAVQFVMHLINGRPNDELKSFSAGLVQYMWDLLGYITFVRDEQPFPVGPYPRHS